MFRVIKIFSSRLRRFARPIAQSSFAVVVGILIGALLMIASGYNPIIAYSALFTGAFGSISGWLETLAFATPLMLTAITFAVGMKAGIFNIGAEGQVYLGAVGAAWVGGWIALPAGLHVAAATAFGMFLGALWALPAALLKIWRGVHEVVSTIMLNWIANYLAIYLAVYWLVGPRAEITNPAMVSARYPLLVEGTSLTAVVLIAIVFCIVIHILLWRTRVGYELRLTGSNPEAASYAGVSIQRAVLISFIVGGLAAGFAGAAQVIGRSPSWALYTNLSNVIMLGFGGIGVALIGRNHPIGGIFAAIFYGGLLHGGRFMEYYAKVPSELVMAIQGLIIVALAIPELLKVLKRREFK
jgi:simple sugar transport system permease protein